MSSVETGQMSLVGTVQMSSAETGQMSAVPESSGFAWACGAVAGAPRGGLTKGGGVRGGGERVPLSQDGERTPSIFGSILAPTWPSWLELGAMLALSWLQLGHLGSNLAILALS